MFDRFSSLVASVHQACAANLFLARKVDEPLKWSAHAVGNRQAGLEPDQFRIATGLQNGVDIQPGPVSLEHSTCIGEPLGGI